jgi:protein required for attachment to host cells
MPRQQTTLIVIADGSRARIFSHRSGEPGLAAVRDLDDPQARQPTRNLVSSGPGHSQESANAAHHAIEPKHDPHEEAEHAFLRRLAGSIAAEAAGTAFNRLVIAAPPRAMGVLRQELSPAARAKLVAEVTKDLTKTPIAELPAHFSDVLRG